MRLRRRGRLDNVSCTRDVPCQRQHATIYPCTMAVWSLNDCTAVLLCQDAVHRFAAVGRLQRMSVLTFESSVIKTTDLLKQLVTLLQ